MVLGGFWFDNWRDRCCGFWPVLFYRNVPMADCDCALRVFNSEGDLMKKVTARVEVISEEIEIWVDDDSQEHHIQDLLDETAHENVRVVDIKVEDE